MLTVSENSTLGVIAIMMFQFQFQFRFLRSCPRLLSLLIVIFWTFFLNSGVFAEHTLPDLNARVEPKAEFGNTHDEAAAHALSLFTLRHGVCTPQYFSHQQLAQGGPLEINGYVVGVLVFGSSDLNVELGGQKLRPIQSNADGTFHVKGYGKFDPAELTARTHMARGGQGLPKATITPPAGAAASAFYYFPKVFGAAVSSQQQFELALVDRNSRQVNHQPAQKIDWVDDGRATPSSTFYYVGDRLDTLLDTENGFQGRLTAIYDGIRLVENAFGLDLVQDVQLIDLHRRNNALTYDGRNTIWFYIDTVLGTSAQELYRIASHEALHQMIYQLRLAHHPDMRRFFADLWNLDKLSMARYQIVTTGWFDSKKARLSASSRLFFSFINEKNFMRGMNGGHSHDNVDEFLTSFIHSLLYIEKLERNLHTPVSMYGTNARHLLKDQEKERILELYKQSINLMLQIAEPANPADHAKRNFMQFLKERLETIEQITPHQAGSLQASKSANPNAETD